MKTTLVLNAAQLKCLASPSRHDVYSAVRMRGQASSSDIAKALERSSESVHYHLKELTRVGLLQIVGKRPAPKKPEAIYEAVGQTIRLPDKNDVPDAFRLSNRLVEAGLRQVVRGHKSAAERAENDPTLRRGFVAIRAAVRLSESDTKKFLKMLEEASIFAKEHQMKEGQQLVWSSVVYPQL